MLSGKHILLGVTGSIAAYKSALLVRCLIKAGAEVKVIMTEMSKHFITPLTMATLSKNPVLVDFFNPENGDWNSHVSLGEWADLLLIAPASANTLAKMSSGVADNLLLTSYLSAKCPTMVAPAMDLDMYKHITTKTNLLILKERGVQIVEPTSGELASGLDGKGRMEEPEKITKAVEDFMSKLEANKYIAVKQDFLGKRVILTGGPTIEHIDPVRYISNHSSGKMAYALADNFAARGAEVLLVSGPVNVKPQEKKVKLYLVQSAEEMSAKVKELYKVKTDILVLCAAVSDYKVKAISKNKIKKTGNDMILNLIPNEDIAAALGKLKQKNAIHIGFALETDHEKTNAEAKLRRKNLDMIVLNSLKDEGTGFAYDTNKVSIISKFENIDYPLKSKKEVAEDIINYYYRIFCSKD
ncbi:MAG: bifunctional phosphopantothenoylcysteine decarboxylase/phosphopantothenate--cysteine ligase CoaBC [Bacteroidales bacterium]